MFKPCSLSKRMHREYIRSVLRNCRSTLAHHLDYPHHPPYSMSQFLCIKCDKVWIIGTAIDNWMCKNPFRVDLLYACASQRQEAGRIHGVIAPWLHHSFHRVLLYNEILTIPLLGLSKYTKKAIACREYSHVKIERKSLNFQQKWFDISLYTHS